MPAPENPKIRHNIIRQYKMGIDTATISLLNNVHIRQVQRYIKRYKDTGTWFTKSELFGDDRGRPPIITSDDLMVLCAVWCYDPTLYLDEVADHISRINNKDIKPTTLVYWMKKLKITRKKLWRYAKEASIAKEQAMWHHFYHADYHVNQFIFIDESHVNDRTINRKFGYSSWA